MVTRRRRRGMCPPVVPAGVGGGHGLRIEAGSGDQGARQQECKLGIVGGLASLDVVRPASRESSRSTARVLACDAFGRCELNQGTERVSSNLPEQAALGAPQNSQV